MKKRGLTPIGIWLVDTGTEQKVFADKMTKARGAKTYQSQVSHWATGSREPSDANIAAMERASGGQVKRHFWPCWRRRNGKSSRQQRASSAS